MMTTGLTGGIACGKSTVAQFFKELGCAHIDADLLARQLTEPGAEAYEPVLKRFGRGILKKDKSLDREELARTVFTDRKALEDLNKIVHPLVRKRESELLSELEKRGEHPVVIVEAALMIETGTFKNYGKIIVVFCEPAIQLERLMRRSDLTREEALSRISSQLPLEEKRKYADYEIDTSGDLEYVYNSAQRIHKELLSDTKGRRE